MITNRSKWSLDRGSRFDWFNTSNQAKCSNLELFPMDMRNVLNSLCLTGILLVEAKFVVKNNYLRTLEFAKYSLKI